MSSFPVPLVPDVIEALFQQLTLNALGIDTLVNPDAAYSAVRIGWQTEGQPSISVDDDVTTLRAVSEDDEYTRIRDRVQSTDGGGNPIQVIKYTRVWRVYWVVQGPNSFDNARKIHSALMTDQGTFDLLSGKNLYLVTDPREPMRVPEQKDSLWWEVMRWEACFNEAVVEAQTNQTVTSAEVIGYNKDGEIFDVTAT